ncbi:hypothetical protein JCM18237_21410 [Halorubrum luteum]
MALTVDPPDPPTLASVDPNEYEDAEVAGGDYRRDELETFLHGGAWEEAFEQWAATSEMDEADWRIVEDLELVARYDFFWDDFADRVGYHAPGLPEDWKERELHPDLDSWGTVSSINAGLTELGQIVCEVLKAEYVDWEAEFEAPDDLPDFEA